MGRQHKATLKLCRFRSGHEVRLGLYKDDIVLDLIDVADALRVRLEPVENVLEFLPGGELAELGRELSEYCESNDDPSLALRVQAVQLLTPFPPPSKFLLVAGNYTEHLLESGFKVAERETTFPYFFWKPPTTTFRASGEKLLLPESAGEYVDWELELGVVIGKTARNVHAEEASRYVAGYTAVNDISNRRFLPNPNRRTRERDSFFDWLHGKWFDGFAPVGPCVVSSRDIPDPQDLDMELRLNGNVEQSGNTSQMIFSVGELLQFITNFVTLEPGDLISTGTPAGVGNAKGRFLRRGDILEGTIEMIGTLTTLVA